MSTVEHLQAAAEHVSRARDAGLDGADLAQVVTATQAVIRTAQAMLMDATAAAHAADVARGQGAASTQSWIAQTAGVSHRDAARDVKLAQELQNAPATRRAMDQPGMSPEKARVITGAMDQLPPQLGDSDRATIEADLVAKAQKHALEDATTRCEAIGSSHRPRVGRPPSPPSSTLRRSAPIGSRSSGRARQTPTGRSRAASCSRSWRPTSFALRSSRTLRDDTTAAEPDHLSRRQAHPTATTWPRVHVDRQRPA